MDGVGRLHGQSRPPACRRCPQKGAAAGDGAEDPAPEAAGQALGRSRGGLTTKVHLACDGRGLPLAVVVPPGNVNDSTVFDAVLEELRVPRAGAGRPRCKPAAVIADKAYSSRAIRQVLRRRAIRAVIPERADQKTNRLRHEQVGGRPPAFDRELYKARNVAERCFGRLKQFRAITIRFDKRADRYKAGVHLAALILWLREPTQDPLSNRTWERPAPLPRRSDGATGPSPLVGPAPYRCSPTTRDPVADDPTALPVRTRLHHLHPLTTVTVSYAAPATSRAAETAAPGVRGETEGQREIRPSTTGRSGTPGRASTAPHACGAACSGRRHRAGPLTTGARGRRRPRGTRARRVRRPLPPEGWSGCPA